MENESYKKLYTAIITLAKHYNLQAYFTTICNIADEYDILDNSVDTLIYQISLLLLNKKFNPNDSTVAHLLPSYNIILSVWDSTELHEIVNNEYTDDESEDSYYNEVLSNLKGIKPIKISDDITLYSKNHKLFIVHDFKTNTLNTTCVFDDMLTGYGLPYYQASSIFIKCFNVLTKSNFNGDVIICDHWEMNEYHKYCRKHARKPKNN